MLNPSPDGGADPNRAEAGNGGWRLDHSYTGLPDLFYARVTATPVASPSFAVFNHALATHLGLDSKTWGQPGAAGYFSGNILPPGASPIAQAYAGHQYGNFTMLGDGRALLLGEQINPDGLRFDIQLKGSGRTPFSRGGDGRAALGPMLREYLISEAMHALEIPTTRSLAVVAAGQPIRRETILPGAILTRVATSHIRVGTYEYAAATGRPGAAAAIADHTIRRHYPELAAAEHPHRELFRAILERQAMLISRWQLVGFVHGVMNTDNMAVSGETIDYGPCAFMDRFDPETVFSSIDHHGRYAYGNQPRIANWNLARLAEAMISLFDKDEEKAIQFAEAELSRFAGQFEKHWISGMRLKLGLLNEEPEDANLVNELLNCLQKHRSDYTNSFRDLASGNVTDQQPASAKDFQDWMARWKKRLARQPQTEDLVRETMRRNNPAFIPRNHKVEEALVAALQGDMAPFHRLLEIVKDPWNYTRPDHEFSAPPDRGAPPYRTFCGT